MSQQPILSEKEQWEIAKLQAETEILLKPWYKKTQWYAQILPPLFGICAVIAAFSTGFVNKQKLVNELRANELKDSIALFTYEKQRLRFMNDYVIKANDSLIKRGDSLNTRIATYELKIRSLDSLYEKQKNDTRSESEQIKSYMIQIVERDSKIKILSEENISLVRHSNQLENDLIIKTKAADDNCEHTISLIYKEMGPLKESLRDAQLTINDYKLECDREKKWIIRTNEELKKENDDLKKQLKEKP